MTKAIINDILFVEEFGNKMKLLEIKNVCKDYKLDNKESFRALNEINVSFDKGELVSIVGESGSGKSTLMNIIGGLDSDFSGEVIVDGQQLKNFKQKELDDYRKKKIGFVFQSFNLIPHLSVLDNVTIPLTLSNEKESVKVEKATAILTKLGLSSQLKKKPTQLSGGQKQRVAIARALINNPDIILADEPTGALDSKTSQQILTILKEIADDGKLVIMVTHSEKVASVSSRVVEISDGKIVKDEEKADYQKIERDEKLIEESPKKEGRLSLLNAFKLSFHNMWASKIKNILMAVGVSISLISMILMLSFGAGLTGYIKDQASGYSSDKVATISKKGSGSITKPKTFTDEEINTLALDINNYLRKQGSNFEVVTKTQDPYENNITYGFNMMTGTGDAETSAAKLVYQPPADGDEEVEPKSSGVSYLYTTPPYVTEKNMITKNGHICKRGEVMLSAAAGKAFGFEKLEDMVGITLTLKINYNDIVVDREVKVSSIVDVSLFSSMMVMYIDYDYLSDLASTEPDVPGLVPSTLYITTDSSKTTELINDFIATRSDLSGSLEQKIVNMLSEMLKTVSSALAVIAGISLAVALIMILVVLYMSVAERTKEIGVLKSIGARKADIRKIFSTESFLVGVLSGITGIIFTLIIGAILVVVFKSILGFAPITMKWYFFLEAMLISVVISVIAGLYPSSKAAKLDPVESLRRE